MKKFIIVSLFVLLIFSFAGCSNISINSLRNIGSQDSSDKSDDDLPFSFINDVSSELDINNFLESKGVDKNISEYPALLRNKIVKEAKKDKIKVTFNEDGTTVFTASDGSALVQNAEGTWSIVADYEAELELKATEWPDNEFTRLIPKPDFTFTGAVTEETRFSVTFPGLSFENLLSYAEQLKTSGFDLDVDESEQDVWGMKIYSLTARNREGYTVELTYASGVNGLAIYK